MKQLLFIREWHRLDPETAHSSTSLPSVCPAGHDGRIYPSTPWQAVVAKACQLQPQPQPPHENRHAWMCCGIGHGIGHSFTGYVRIPGCVRFNVH